MTHIGSNVKFLRYLCQWCTFSFWEYFLSILLIAAAILDLCVVCTTDIFPLFSEGQGTYQVFRNKWKIQSTMCHLEITKFLGHCHPSKERPFVPLYRLPQAVNLAPFRHFCHYSCSGGLDGKREGKTSVLGGSWDTPWTLSHLFRPRTHHPNP